MQCRGEDAEDHDLHGVRHPAQPGDEAQDDLELAETDGVDGLGDREGVVRDHTGRRSRHLPSQHKHKNYSVWGK